MSSVSPSQLFSGIQYVSANSTVAADSIAIPLSDLQGLSVAESDPNTGDGRELVRIFLERVFVAIEALNAADRPARFTIAKTQSLPGGIQLNQLRQTYTTNIDLQIIPSEINPASEV